MRSSSEIFSQLKAESAKLTEFQESLTELEAYITQMKNLKTDIDAISTSLNTNLKVLVKNAVSGQRGATISDNVDTPIGYFNSASSNLESAIEVAEETDMKWLKMSIHNKELQIEELERDYRRALAREAEESSSKTKSSGGGGGGGTPAKNMLK